MSTNPDATVGGLYEEPQCWRSPHPWCRQRGQSVIANLVYGTRTSLIVGLIAGLIGTAIGLLVGLVAGYRGGWVDDVLSAIVNVGLAIPVLVIVILVSVSLPQRNLYTLALVIGFTGWFWVARAVRRNPAASEPRTHRRGQALRSRVLVNPAPRRPALPALVCRYGLHPADLQRHLVRVHAEHARPGRLGYDQPGHDALLGHPVGVGADRAWWAFIPPTVMLTLIVFSLLLLQSSLNEVFNPGCVGVGPRERGRRTKVKSSRCLSRPKTPAGWERWLLGDTGFSRTWGVALMGTLVNAENIRGVYYTGAKDVVAVNDVSIKIEEGEVLGLAGESGSGKTTLGSIISLIARPPLHVEHGTLEIDGQVQELGGHAKIPRTWRGAVVSMLPQGAMNSVSPTKRIRQLVYDVMRSHDERSPRKRRSTGLGTGLPRWACRPGSSMRTLTSSPVA